MKNSTRWSLLLTRGDGDNDIVVTMDSTAAPCLNCSRAILVEMGCDARYHLAWGESERAGSEAKDGGDGLELHDCGDFDVRKIVWDQEKISESLYSIVQTTYGFFELNPMHLS